MLTTATLSLSLSTSTSTSTSSRARSTESGYLKKLSDRVHVIAVNLYKVTKNSYRDTSIPIPTHSHTHMHASTRYAASACLEPVNEAEVFEGGQQERVEREREREGEHMLKYVLDEFS